MSEFKSFDEAMTAGAAHAVELARRGNVVLDYSLESIRVVEHQLSRLHDQIPKPSPTGQRVGGPSDQEIKSMSLAFGAYIGEVFKRHFGGHWSDTNSMQPEVKILTFHFDAEGGGEIWPQIKVEKRLRNGPEDNVWHFACVLVERINARKAPG